MDIIISIRPDYVFRIASGAKQIEIRTRRPQLDPGDVMWVYETLPTGSISLRAEVIRVLTMDSESAWREHRKAMGVSRREFMSYINGQRVVSLIFLGEPTRLRAPVHLDVLRRICDGFMPPQFMRIVREPSLLRQLNEAA